MQLTESSDYWGALFAAPTTPTSAATTTTSVVSTTTSFQFPWWFYMLVAVVGALVVVVLGLTLALIFYCMAVRQKARVHDLYSRSARTVYAHACHRLSCTVA